MRFTLNDYNQLMYSNGFFATKDGNYWTIKTDNTEEKIVGQYNKTTKTLTKIKQPLKNWLQQNSFIKQKNTMKTKKKGLNASAKKKTITAKKLCSSVIVKEGLKKDGTLKKGFKYAKGGKIVKAKAKK